MALSYEEYLASVVELAKRVSEGPGVGAYPASLDSRARRALFDNLGRDEELGPLCVFLASDLQSYTSGCIINVDGGMSARR